MEKSLRKILWVFLVLAIALGFRFALEYLFNIIWEFFDLSSIFGFVVRSFIVIIFALVWLSITLRSDKPYQRLPWLLLLTFEPVAGMTLFLTFGRSFKRSRRFRKRPLMKKSNYITHENKQFHAQKDLNAENHKYADIFNTAHQLSYHRPYQNSTKTKILKNGEAFFPSLFEAIKDAESFIFIQFYIFRTDALGKEVTEKLMQKAKEGVDVKVIFDGLGSATARRSHFKKMREAGIDLVLNDKIYFPLFNTRVNYRNHRKIVVIDGKIGFTGGMNLANEYDNRTKHPYYFRDTMIRLEGTAVKSLTSIFLKDYYYNTNTFLDTQKYYPDYRTSSKGVVQIIQSGPDSEEAHIRDLYLKMIFSAKKSIKIMTPYMAMDQETLTALKVAVKSGIDVSIIIPGVPDKQLVYMITQSFVSSLLDYGVKIYKYQRGFCHSKVLMVDDEIASIGTYNLDNRSAFLSFEVSTLTTNRTATDSLIRDFENDLDDSTLITCEMWRGRNVFMRFLENLLAILSPII
ncbi:MAG: cardiolipin synthase [Bacillota bacterium]